MTSTIAWRCVCVLLIMNAQVLGILSIDLSDIPPGMLPEGFSIDDIPPGFDFNNIPPGMLPEGFNPADIPAGLDLNNIPADMITAGVGDDPESIQDTNKNNVDNGNMDTDDSDAMTNPLEEGTLNKDSSNDRDNGDKENKETTTPMIQKGLITSSLVFNVSALIGETVVLTCTKVPGSKGPVLWLHAADGSPVSRDRVVTDALTSRMEIIGDPVKNEYNLVIKYLLFPMDEGRWSCLSFDGMIQHSYLTVLVPPPSPAPHVTPDNISVLDPYSDAWTFTCTAHFAHPPVELTWTRISGQNQEYDVTPSSSIRSSDNTQAVSSKLIVTARNFGSVFACSASHPAYNGKVYSKTALFLPPRALEAVGYLKARAMSLIPRLSLGSSDYAMVSVILFVAFIVFITGACLFTSRKKWELDVRLPLSYSPIVASGDVSSHNGSSKRDSIQPAKDTKKTNHERRTKAERRKCISRVVCGSILSGLLLFSLLFAVPLYMKGVSIPMLSVNEFTSVVAGSALWLDCSSLVHPVGSLLQITWRKNADQIYKQYMVNKQQVGYPYNSTMGQRVGSRVSSNQLGQISIWPMRGGEEGVYSCEVAGIMDDTGRTKLKMKTFGVFVVTGVMVNYPLLGVLGLCFLCTAGLIALGISHACKRAQQNHRPSVALNRAVHDSSTKTETPNDALRNDNNIEAVESNDDSTESLNSSAEHLEQPVSTLPLSKAPNGISKAIGVTQTQTQTYTPVQKKLNGILEEISDDDIKVPMDTWDSEDEEDEKDPNGQQHSVYVQVNSPPQRNGSEKEEPEIEEAEEDTYLLPVDIRTRPKINTPVNNNDLESTHL